MMPVKVIPIMMQVAIVAAEIEIEQGLKEDRRRFNQGVRIIHQGMKKSILKTGSLQLYAFLIGKMLTVYLQQPLSSLYLRDAMSSYLIMLIL
jgi:hypothetical protein